MEFSERTKICEERDRLLSLSDDLICMAGTDGYFTYVNPAWGRTLGYLKEELLSRPSFDFMHPDGHD